MQNMIAELKKKIDATFIASLYFVRMWGTQILLGSQEVDYLGHII